MGPFLWFIFLILITVHFTINKESEGFAQDNIIEYSWVPLNRFGFF